MRIHQWNKLRFLERLPIATLFAMLRGFVLAGIIIVALTFAARQTHLLDRQLIFFPTSDMIASPADLGMPYEDVSFSASDGIQLHGWYVPGDSDVTLLWFHGNAGNISHRVENLLLMRERLEANVFVFDYRGYGLSQGQPSEAGIYKDGEAALEYLRSRPGIDEDKIVLFGRSLGAAVAVELATRDKFPAVILESPFTSVQAMARRVYPILSHIIPTGWVVKSKLDSLSKIGLVESPVMVLHGDKDEVVPFEVGRELFDAANEPKRFYTIKGAGHNNIYTAGGEPYMQALKSFIDEYVRSE